MNARRVEITLSVETFDRLEQQRGFEPRASFIKRVLESALGGDGAIARGASPDRRPANPSTADNGPPASTGKPPAPTRTPAAVARTSRESKAGVAPRPKGKP